MSNTKRITCQICGKEFEQTAPNQKYCCLICAAAGRKKKRNAWEKQNPNYNNLYYAQRNKTPHPPTANNGNSTGFDSRNNAGNTAEGRG